MGFLLACGRLFVGYFVWVLEGCLNFDFRIVIWFRLALVLYIGFGLCSLVLWGVFRWFVGGILLCSVLALAWVLLDCYC